MSPRHSVLITGASSGFGHLAALTLAERGHRVYASMRDLAGRNADASARLLEQASQKGWDLHTVELDVTDDASIAAAVERVLDLGDLDVVINNAGAASSGLLESFTAEQVESVFRINALGAIRVNRAVLPHLRSRGEGLLVHVTSGSGRMVLPYFGPYTAAKFALEAIAETYRYELRPLGIDSVIVEPAAYATELGANALRAEDASYVAEYGETGTRLQSILTALSGTPESVGGPGPQEVVDAIVTLVETEQGHRPLRTAVGATVEPLLNHINQAAADKQRDALTLMGLADLTG
ncbi:SDR family oxidoreductase [Streptomyces sp. NPDC048639]|uniref:SDR family oxidoreductase n=1 Tax=Streptomyces sp. NPDC048639 TaxID=3365581 RepID=UPI0037173683